MTAKSTLSLLMTLSRRVPLALLTVLVAGKAMALDGRIVKELMELAPQERMEQRCDVEAMDRIRREQKGFRPDKVIAYTFAEPEVEGNELKAPGAVFRSEGEWYRLKFKCETGAEHVNVKSFEYKIGKLVPKEDWQENYLYD